MNTHLQHDPSPERENLAPDFNFRIEAQGIGEGVRERTEDLARRTGTALRTDPVPPPGELVG
jgi:hypothetical protein